MAIKADEKKAFEAMLAEMSDEDSDSDEDIKNKIKRQQPSSNSRQSSQSSQLKSSTTAMPKSSSIASEYVKRSQEQENIDNFGIMNQSSGGPSDDVMAMKRMVLRPCNRHDNATLCFVEREKTGFGILNPIYRLYLEGTKQNQPPRFVMAAKKKSNNKTSYYLFSTEMNPDDRGSENVIGKLRGNAVGSQYIITDGGLSPEKTILPSSLRKELGLVNFEFDSGGPSSMEVWIPLVQPSGPPVVFQPTDEENTMEMRIQRRDYSGLFPLQNKRPKWDDAHGGHVLNFQGRVTESSVKNFQLCSADPNIITGDDVLLQFGRTGRNTFAMDVRYPLSLFQAFAICVACMDGKIADRKGYEYVRKLTGQVDEDDNNTPRSNSSYFTTKADEKPSGPMNAEVKSTVVEGSILGSRSYGGSLRQAMPSGQYIRDKINRSLK